MKKKIYLAGPDVFLPNAKAVLAAKKAMCAAYGFEGLSPMDTELNDKANVDPTVEVAMKIYQFDASLMKQADAILANMEPFRGPSMDTGTAFEMGYMDALDKPIIGYSNNLRPYKEKYTAFNAHYFGRPYQGKDYQDPFSIVEDFSLVDNLMMVQSVRKQGIEILPSFEEALRTAAILVQPCHPCHDHCPHRQEGEANEKNLDQTSELDQGSESQGSGSEVQQLVPKAPSAS